MDRNALFSRSHVRICVPLAALALAACGSRADAPVDPTVHVSAEPVAATPIEIASAGSDARRFFGVAEWRMYSGRTSTFVIGHGDDGAPRRGLRVDPHAAKDGVASYLEVSFLDGSSSHLYMFPSGAKLQRRMTTDQALLAAVIRRDMGSDAKLGLVKATVAGAHVTPVRVRDGSACTDARLDAVKNAAGTGVQCVSDGLAAGEGAAVGCASLVWLFGVGCLAGGVIGGVAGFLASDAVFDFLPQCTDAPGTISAADAAVRAACDPPPAPAATDPLRACCVQMPGKDCFWNDDAKGCVCEERCGVGQTCMGLSEDDYSPTAYDDPAGYVDACASCGAGAYDLSADPQTGALKAAAAKTAPPKAAVPVDGDRLCAGKQGADLYCGYELGAAKENANRRYECVNGDFYGSDDCASCTRSADAVDCSTKPAAVSKAAAPTEALPPDEDG